jgi:hypothetical protein
MGTRHLISVIKDGEYKVAQYGQWDGYPSGQGRDILEFLTRYMDRNIFENKLNQLTWATEEEIKNMWVECGADPENEWVNMKVSDEFQKRYPENNRDTGSEILHIIQNSNKHLKLQNNIDFAGNSLYCEWAYVIDLDRNTFEVYKGFNKNPLNEDERFYFLQKEESKYHPVKHVFTFDLNNLPDEETFLSKSENEEDEEE